MSPLGQAALAAAVLAAFLLLLCAGAALLSGYTREEPPAEPPAPGPDAHRLALMDRLERHLPAIEAALERRVAELGDEAAVEALRAVRLAAPSLREPVVVRPD